MSAIDELKDGITIDTVGNDELTIDTTEPAPDVENDTISLSTITGNKKSSSGARSTITIDAMETKKEDPDPNIHKSIEHDLLNLDDPNSMISKYAAEKQVELDEMAAQRAEEEALRAEEEATADEEDDEEVSSSLVSEEFASETTSTENLEAVEAEDISSLIDDSETEEVAKEETPKEPEEPVQYDAPDIDVEISTGDTGYATEIVEEDEAEEVAQNTDTEDTLKHLQKLATEKLKPVSKSLDISSFTVLKKPITNITPIFEAQKARVCKWVLPAQESTVFMKEFSGSELEKLRQYSENNRSLDSLNRRYHMIYDHIVSPKPATFESWLKTTPFEDVDHYFFAIYIASFKGSNFLPEDCINKDCEETFLTDDVDIMEMVKFDTKEAKEKFAELYQSEATPAGKGVYCTEVVPVSNNIAISFRQPSIYNIFELATIDDKTRTNYASILEYIPYIDTIYSIDTVNRTLVPITYKMFADNAQRTVRSKIQKFDNIFNTLSVDEFGPIKAYIAAIADKTTGMRYVYPAVECPKCHSMTNEQRASAEELVFTRYQLGSLVSTSLS